MLSRIEIAQRKLDSVSGDRISADMTPTALFEVLEANVVATLAVADALERLLDHIVNRP